MANVLFFLSVVEEKMDPGPSAPPPAYNQVGYSNIMLHYAFACGAIGLTFELQQCLVTGMWKRLARWPRGWQVLHQR